MATISATNSLESETSKAWSLVVAGYSIAALGLVAFLTINGASGTPATITIGTAGLIAIGIMLPAIGMLQLRRSVYRTSGAAKRGLAMQSLGLVGLLFGVILIVVVPSLSGYLVGAVLIAASGASTLVGTLFLKKHYFSIAAPNAGGAKYLILGTALIFSGVGLIAGSNIAFEYLISQVQNTVNVDVGATVTACGFVLAACSFFVLRNSR